MLKRIPSSFLVLRFLFKLQKPKITLKARSKELLSNETKLLMRNLFEPLELKIVLCGVWLLKLELVKI